MSEIIAILMIIYFIYVIGSSIITGKAHDYLYLILFVVIVGLFIEIGGCKNTDDDFPEYEKGGTKIYYNK